MSDSKKKILIVDDDESMRKMLIEYLSEGNFTLLEATNGEDAIQVASNEKPDVILMDANMPVLDGWSATMKIKELGLENTKIISITVFAERDSAESCGSDDYIRKPFSQQQLLDKISSYL